MSGEILLGALGKNDSLPADSATLIDVLRWRARYQSDQRIYTFLRNGEEEDGFLTYGELDQQARRIGAHLQDIAKPGDRAMLLYPAGLDFIAAFFGCLYAGVLAVPAYPPRNRRHLPRIEAILKNSAADLVLVDSQFETRIQTWISQLQDGEKRTLLNCAVLSSGLEKEWRDPQVTPDSLAFVQYTSGSTATPKGVVVSHGNLICNQRMIHQASGHTSDSVFATWLPMYHDMGLIGNIIQPLYIGSQSILMSPTAALQKPIRWLEAISRYRAKTTGAPNFAYDLCVQTTTPAQRRTLDLSSLEVVYNGSEPVRPDTLERFANAFASCGFRSKFFYPCYGLAEATLLVSGGDMLARPIVRSFDKLALEENRVVQLDPGSTDEYRLVGCGRAAVDERIEIVDAQTLRRCQEGQVGEVWVSGPHVAQCYWGNATATEETFRAYIADSGAGPFLRTGDLGFVADGELFIVGRLKDLVIIRGRNHYPQDIERTVEQCHAALHASGCAAFAVEAAGEERLVIIQEVKRGFLRNPAVEDVIRAIRQAVAEQHGLEPYRVLLIKPGTLPKTSSGKIQRRACRALEGGPNAVGEWQADHELEKAPWENIGETSGRTIDALKKCRPEQRRDLLLEFISGQVQCLLGRTSEFEFEPQDTLNKMGLDSLRVFDLIARIESEMGIAVDIEALSADLSMAQLVEVLLDCWDKTGLDSRVKGQRQEVGDPTVFVSQIQEKLLQIPQINRSVTHQSNRQLQIDGKAIVDFASCNYLGFDHHPDIKKAIPPMIDQWGVHPSWTRAVASPAPYGELETQLARFLAAPEVIIFPSVAMLNMGILPILTGPDGVIITDHDVHATVQEACELVSARGGIWAQFKHNDLGDLENQLKKYSHKPYVIVAIDGVYSMSAEYANLPEYSALVKKYNALLYVDDAHGFGIIGESPTAERPYGCKGNGLVKYYGMDYEEDRIIYVAGLSKAYSSYAAFVTCFDGEMKQRFQMATSYIFSGPIPTASIASGLAGLRVNEREGEAIRDRLYRFTAKLVDGARALGFEVDSQGGFPIVFIVIGGVDRTIRACQIAWEHGLLITPGVFPAAPIHRGGLRFSITASNTEGEIGTALEVLKILREEL